LRVRTRPSGDRSWTRIARHRRRRCCSNGLRRGAVPDRVDAEQHRRIFRVNGRLPTMTCTAVAVEQR
jgi:hypothetical protein